MTWITIESTSGTQHSRRVNEIRELTGTVVDDRPATLVILDGGGTLETWEAIGSLQERLNEADKAEIAAWNRQP